MAERLMIFLQSCLGNKMDNRFIGSEIMGHRFNRSFNLVLINSCFKSDIAYSLVKILLGYRYFFTPSYLLDRPLRGKCILNSISNPWNPSHRCWMSLAISLSPNGENFSFWKECFT